MYPTQSGVLNRLEAETRRAGREHEDACVQAMAMAWKDAKRAMRGHIMAEYHASHGRDAWNLRTAAPTIQRMGRFVMGTLSSFHSLAVTLTRQAISSSYRGEALRQVWMLDQLTPPSYRPRLPKRALREAAAPFSITWEDALAEWLKAYAANLATNLRLEALHEGSMADAGDEVDAARVDAFDPAYKFASMLTNQILKAQRDARADVGDDNGVGGDDGGATATDAGDDLVAEEVFQTMEDADVCPDCDSQDGVEVDQVDVFGHVYGFNCRCFERIVPREFAELLRDGDDDEKAAALVADARGLVPDAMVVKDDAGDLVGTFVIPFPKWVQQRAAIDGMNLTGGGYTVRAR